jgi:hypothetical protein
MEKWPHGKPFCSSSARWISGIWPTLMDSAPGKIELEYTNRITLVPGIIKAMRSVLRSTIGSSPERNWY